MHTRLFKPLRIIVLLLLSLIIVNCSTGPLAKGPDAGKVDLRELQMKAIQAYNDKDYASAVKYYESVLNHNQDAFIIAYNLACSYALMGDADQASNYVNHAFANGFRNIEFMHKDPDFDPIREDEGFQETLKRLDERFKAIGILKYVKAESFLPYRIRLPKNYDASKSYPLLIGMHGNGGNADAFIALYDVLEDPQVIYVAPEGQYPLSLNIGPQFHRRTWALAGVNKATMMQADLAVESYILSTINEVSQEYKVSNVYLMGFSQGAAYAYTVGIRNPEHIKGVIGFSGYLPDFEGKNSILTKRDIENGKDVRIYVAHGIDDAAIGVEEARITSVLLEEQGYEVSYMEFEGHHGVKADIFNHAVGWMQK